MAVHLAIRRPMLWTNPLCSSEDSRDDNARVGICLRHGGSMPVAILGPRRSQEDDQTHQGAASRPWRRGRIEHGWPSLRPNN